MHATFLYLPHVYFCSGFFLPFPFLVSFFFEPAAGLAQSVERLTALREVVGSIPGAKLTLQDLK